MIDKIKNNIPNTSNNVKTSSHKQVDVSTAKQAQSQAVFAEKSSQLSKEIANKTNISQFVSKSKVKDMAKEPPIDKANVSRIKNAIANGSYPVDLEKIADSLMEAYKELK